jgi:hypothetical protein
MIAHSSRHSSHYTDLIKFSLLCRFRGCRLGFNPLFLPGIVTFALLGLIGHMKAQRIDAYYHLPSPVGEDAECR